MHGLFFVTDQIFRAHFPVKNGSAFHGKQGRASGEPGGEIIRLDAARLARCSSREARLLIPFDYAEDHTVLPLALQQVNGREILTVAADASAGADLQAALRFLSGREIKLVPAERAVLTQAIFAAYKGDEKPLAQKASAISAIKTPEAAKANSFRGIDGIVPEFLETLVDYAVSKRASDIHIAPRRDGTFVTLRVNGVLLGHEKPLCSIDLHKRLINRIKVLARLDTASRECVHEGSFFINENAGDVCVRVSIVPTVHGEKAVLRLHGALELKELASLGLDRLSLAELEDAAQRPSGVVLFVGPTGCGKTTTMYALLSRLRARNLNLASIEDPVEIVMPGVAQSGLDSSRGLDYPSCLKAILRQDPDCVMLGEIRDRTCAQAAFEAAKTGHMVLSSIHGGSLGDVFLRLEDFGISRVTLSQSLRLVVHQRLFARLCENCKVLDLAASNEMKFNVFRKVGCHECDYSGTYGRVMVSEGLHMNAELASTLLETGLVDLIKKLARGTGLRTEMRSALAGGRISFDDFAGCLK